MHHVSISTTASVATSLSNLWKHMVMSISEAVVMECTCWIMHTQYSHRLVRWLRLTDMNTCEEGATIWTTHLICLRPVLHLFQSLLMMSSSYMALDSLLWVGLYSWSGLADLWSTSRTLFSRYSMWLSLNVSVFFSVPWACQVRPIRVWKSKYSNEAINGSDTVGLRGRPWPQICD